MSVSNLRPAFIDMFHSPPIRAPFSATERFITKTTTATASIATANRKKQSKYANADDCW